MKKFCSLTLAVALLATLASAQTVTLGTGVVVNTGTGYPAPYGNYWGGARHQFLITAAELTAAGGAAGNLVSLGFDVVTVGGAPLTGFTISAGHTLQVPSATLNATWESGLTMVYGPVTHTAAVGWNTHSFSTAFAWDGVSNVMLETCFNNLSYTTNCTFRQTNTGFRTTKLYRNDNMPTVCAGTGSNYTGFNRPNMQLTFGAPPAPDYQVNQAGAYMDFDFVIATAGAAAITNKCAGAQVNACAESFGMVADIFLNTAAVVPSSAGGVALNNSNVVNLDLTAGFFQLLGTFMPVGGAAGTCPILFGAPLGTLSAQMVAFDATSAIGISLSQACQLNGFGTSTLSLPTADDVSYLVDLTAAPLCRTAGVPFYGTTYTQIHVSTNGVVCPGTSGQTGWTPSAGAAQAGPGSVGIWSDWQSNASPTATIVVNGAGISGGVDVTYTNVPYWGTAVTSTFNVGLDAVGPRIEGITGLGTDPTGTGIVLSQGGGLATNPGAALFSLGGAGGSVLATDMLYNIGTGSPALGGGANNIWFTAQFSGGYFWQGL